MAVTLCCCYLYNCYEIKFSHCYSLTICSRKDATSLVCGVFWVWVFHQLDKCVNSRLFSWLYGLQTSASGLMLSAVVKLSFCERGRKETLAIFASHWFLSRIKEKFSERTGHDFCICVGQWTQGQDLLTRNSKGTADSALCSPYNYMERATPTCCLGLSGHSLWPFAFKTYWTSERN